MEKADERQPRRKIPEFLRKREQDIPFTESDLRAMGIKPQSWLRRKAEILRLSLRTWLGMVATSKMLMAVHEHTRQQDRLIAGLRADLEATQRSLADARGETQRVEHYLELYREQTVATHYELRRIPYTLRRKRRGRRVR